MVSCLKVHILQFSPALASNPMVFCFLPGNRPASVTFCMTSACCSTWWITLVWFEVCANIVAVHSPIKKLLYFLLYLFVFETFVFGFVSLLLSSFVLQLHRACIVSFAVIQCAYSLRQNMCCLLLQLQYLPPPWGDCKSTPIDSEYFSTYSITACRIDCETRYLLENCNCRMVHMPGRNWKKKGLTKAQNVA